MQSGKSAVVLIAVFVVGAILGGLLKSDNFGPAHVLAQSTGGGSAGGVMAFTGQIDRDQYGIIMVDVDAGTLWVYQLKRPGNQLKLMATRSWMYDRYLEEFNCAEPTPGEVARLIDQRHPPAEKPKKLESKPPIPTK